MADFGDEVGGELNSSIRTLIERKLLYGRRMQSPAGRHGDASEQENEAQDTGGMWDNARQWFEQRFRRDPPPWEPETPPETQALTLSRRPSLGVEMPSDEVARLFAAYAREQGVWAYAFHGASGEAMLGFYQEDAPQIVRCAEEWMHANPQTYQEWDAYARDQVRRDAAETMPELPPAEKQYMRDIREKVETARKGAANREEFIRRCEAQGLSVGRAADGELLFTHENGWFDVRADTLGKEYTLDAFERGTGEKSDVTQLTVEEQERYIQSHDGGDIDTRTRVVEHDVKTQDKGQPDSKAYDLDTEAKDMREASRALDAGRSAKEIGPLER